MNVSGILQSNLSCELEKSYSFVDKWEAHHYPEDICLFQLPSNLRTGCGANDDGFRVLGCKSVYTQIEQVIYFFSIMPYSCVHFYFGNNLYSMEKRRAWPLLF